MGANILNTGLKKDGISHQEKSYIQGENYTKYLEGKIWGTMMGAFGACYAVRKGLFAVIPPNFMMEDFYITMHVLSNNKKAINELEAICEEDVSNKMEEEFKRKVRISTGNFQNLGVFWKLMWPPFSGLAFSFFSHKLLRWIGPWLLLSALICAGILGEESQFYRTLFGVQVLLAVSPLIDHLLKKQQVHLALLRYISYFYAMNLALLIGFFKYMKGVKTSAWRPTERNLAEETSKNK